MVGFLASLAGSNEGISLRHVIRAKHKDFFDSLWSQAAYALKRAERLVLCGYSLLAVDERACELLLKAPSRSAEVTIVSGSQGQRIARHFKESGFENVKPVESGHFESWVKGTR